MATSTTITMITPCEICGDPGISDAIITCCECKVTREHIYCMRVIRTRAPTFWRCEECDEKKLVSPKTTFEQKTQTVSNVVQQATSVIDGPIMNRIASKLKFKEEKVDKGRTKYISCDEAVKLSSGSFKLKNSPRKEFCGPTRSPCASQKSTEKPVTPIQNKGNANQSFKSPISSRSAERRNPEREMNTKKNELQSPRKAAIISRNTEVKNLKETETKSGCKKDGDMKADAGKPNPTSGLLVSVMHHDPYIPSLNSYWKGCFYLPNGPANPLDALKAHPPSTVHRKVYDTMKKMPEDIHFELVPNSKIWMEIFPAGNGPDRDDIGLYFFPMFKMRCENYVSVIDFIWREKLVLKSNVEGVELLVFSSRVLPSHSQEFEGNLFLWGVFCRPKAVKTVANTRALLEVKREPCEDVPPGFKKIQKPGGDDVPPGFKKIDKGQ